MTQRTSSGLFAAPAALLAVLAAFAAAALPADATRARDVLPAEGLIASSVADVRDQAGLDAHYYLADEAVLALGRRADAVLARYRAAAGEALLFVVGYPSARRADAAYGRFGADFFPGSFAPGSRRTVERIETGDWAGAARRGRFQVIIFEAPDRSSCEDLLRRAEDRIAAGP